MVTLPKEEFAVTFPVPQLLVWQKGKKTLYRLNIPVKYNLSIDSVTQACPS